MLGRTDVAAPLGGAAEQPPLEICPGLSNCRSTSACLSGGLSACRSAGLSTCLSLARSDWSGGCASGAAVCLDKT